MTNHSIGDLPDATTPLADQTWIATAEGVDDDVKRPVSEVFDPGGVLDHKSVAHAEASTARAEIKHIRTQVFSEVTGQGGAKYRRVDQEPVHDLKFRTLDRWTAAGNHDAVNGGWWEIEESALTLEMAGAPRNGGDASPAVQRAIDYLHARGSGTLYSAGYVYDLHSTVILKSGITIDLAGGCFRRGGSTYHTLLKSEGFDVLTGTSESGGPIGVTLMNMRLDGNWLFSAGAVPADTFEGCGLLYYGRQLRLENVTLQSAIAGRGLRGHGIWTEYTGSGSPYGHQYLNTLIDGVGRSGWYHACSDAQGANVIIRSVARAGEEGCDGLALGSMMRGKNINVWQPATGLHVDNMRYACNILSVAAFLDDCTFEHGRAACLHVAPQCANAIITANIHTVRGEEKPVALIRGRCGTYDLHARPGTFYPNAPLLHLGQVGDGNTSAQGNNINVVSRDGTPVAIVDFVNSNGGNKIAIGGRINALAGVIRGTPHVTDMISISGINMGILNGTMAPRDLHAVTAQTTSATVATQSLNMGQMVGTWLISGTIVARQTAGSGSGRKAWSFSAMFSRNGSAGTASAVGTPTVDVLHQFAASPWTALIDADTTVGGPRFSFGGEADKAIIWVVDARVTEVRN